MSKRELYTKDKNTKVHSYKIRFSPEEKQLLDLKRQQYGYKYLSDYIRDASIYENVIQIDVSYTDAVVDLFQTYITEIRKFTKEVRRILKYATSLSDEERELLQQSLYRVYSQTKSLKKSVNDNLDIEAIVKQSKERIYKQQLAKLEKDFERINNNGEC